MSDEAALVLAAGKGTRMRSTLPKVLHEIAGKSMLTRVLDNLGAAGFHHPTVIVGYGADRIRRTVGDRCRYVDQGEQLGTGHAGQVGFAALPDSARRVLLVHGDEPLIEPEIYDAMLALARERQAAIVLLTAKVSDTRDFGRVVRDAGGRPAALVQQSDLTAEQQDLREVNLGAYVFDVDFLRRHLGRLRPHPPKGEYYLTDLVAAAATDGATIDAVTLPDGDDVLGVNDLVQLERATHTVFRRTNRRLMLSGVTIVDSASTFIGEDVRVEPDTIIAPFTIISGQSVIGSACTIGPRTTIEDSEIGHGCRVNASTVERSTVDDNVVIGPYAHLRPGAAIGAGAEIGNYAEIKAASLGEGTKMHHVGYIGDARIGRNVNIGAGAVTCNFDGVAKHRTVVEDDAFVGSDTMLRAPVTVGKGAYTGAGSVVTRNVAAGSVVAGVPARVIKEGQERE